MSGPMIDLESALRTQHRMGNEGYVLGFKAGREAAAKVADDVYNIGDMDLERGAIRCAELIRAMPLPVMPI